VDGIIAFHEKHEPAKLEDLRLICEGAHRDGTAIGKDLADACKKCYRCAPHSS
jgi:hypothetical protein